MRKLAALALALSSVVSCTQKASAPTDRVELRKLSGNTIELVPNLDHPGYG